MEKNCIFFVVKKLYFVNFFGLRLDLDFEIQNFLEYGWTWN